MGNIILKALESLADYNSPYSLELFAESYNELVYYRVSNPVDFLSLVDIEKLMAFQDILEDGGTGIIIASCSTGERTATTGETIIESRVFVTNNKTVFFTPKAIAEQLIETLTDREITKNIRVVGRTI